MQGKDVALRPNPVTHRCGNEVVGGIIIKPNPWKKRANTQEPLNSVIFSPSL